TEEALHRRAAGEDPGDGEAGGPDRRGGREAFRSQADHLLLMAEEGRGATSQRTWAGHAGEEGRGPGEPGARGGREPDARPASEVGREGNQPVPGCGPGILESAARLSEPVTGLSKGRLRTRSRPL